MRKFLMLCVGLATSAAAGCMDAETAAGPVAPRASLMAPDRAEFMIRGASYGADGGEVTNSNCSGTYSWSQETQNWAVSGDPIWVYSTKYDRVGCVIGTGGGGDNYVGGNLSIYADGNGYSQGVGIVADQMAVGELTGVPTSGTTVYLSASPWSSFRFYYWEVTRANGSKYRVCTPDFERSGNTDEYDYLAIFKECTTHWSDSSKCVNDPYIGTNTPCEGY